MISHWDLNKETIVNTALVKFKETNGDQGGYEILRYAEKGVLEANTGYTADELKEWKSLNLGDVLMRLAKAGELKFVKN